jgi:hypothetical protein
MFGCNDIPINAILRSYDSNKQLARFLIYRKTNKEHFHLLYNTSKFITSNFKKIKDVFNPISIVSEDEIIIFIKCDPPYQRTFLSKYSRYDKNGYKLQIRMTTDDYYCGRRVFFIKLYKVKWYYPKKKDNSIMNEDYPFLNEVIFTTKMTMDELKKMKDNDKNYKNVKCSVINYDKFNIHKDNVLLNEIDLQINKMDFAKFYDYKTNTFMANIVYNCGNKSFYLMKILKIRIDAVLAYYMEKYKPKFKCPICNDCMISCMTNSHIKHSYKSDNTDRIYNNSVLMYCNNYLSDNNKIHKNLIGLVNDYIGNYYCV